METAPFFSIIIPALNEEKYLPILLKDLANQSITDFEVIVVDGKSTDHTVERCEEIAKDLPMLTIVVSDIRNVSHQRNLGAEKAVGKYLVFNDADNRLPKYFLEGLKYRLHSFPTDMFTTYCLPDKNTSTDKVIATSLNLMLETYNMVGTPGALGAMIGVLRSKFPQTGKFDPKIPFAEDTVLIRQGVKNGLNFTVIRDPKFVYSLRRYRKNGVLKTVQKSAVLYIKQMTGQDIDQKKEYPMGGKYHKADNRTKLFIDQLNQPFPKTKKNKKKITDYLKALISLEED